MTTKKVLLLENGGADYGAYFLTKGFCDLVGVENVRMWPYKRTNAGGVDHYPERCHGSQVIRVGPGGKPRYGTYVSGSELWADRALWRLWKPERGPVGAPIANDGPVGFMQPLPIPEAADDEIFAMIERGEFALIVLNGARWHGSAALHELQATFGHRLPPVAFCDHDDYPQLRWDFCDAFKPAVYFKRTTLRDEHPHRHLLGPPRRGVITRPLPFSSAWNHSWIPWNERDIDVFCIFGNTQKMRQRTKEVTIEVCSRFPNVRVMSAVGHPMNHPEYLKTLTRCKIVIDQQSFGTDTLRFWEAASVGAHLVSDFNVVTPRSQVAPGDHYLKYDNDLSPTGDKQNFVRFREVLVEAVLGLETGSTEARARRLYDFVRADHKCVDRAAFVVSEVRSAGHGLDGLS